MRSSEPRREGEIGRPVKECNVLLAAPLTSPPRLLSIYPIIFRSKLELGGGVEEANYPPVQKPWGGLGFENYPNDSHYLQSTF